MQKKFLAIRKTLTLAPSEGAAGEINSKGIEKTGGYPNGEEISLSRQRSPRELCGAGRRRARRTRERAEAAGRGRGAAQRRVYPQISVVTRLKSRKLGQGFWGGKSSLTSNFREWFPLKHWISKQFLLQPHLSTSCARPHQNPRLASQSRKSDQKNTHYI